MGSSYVASSLFSLSIIFILYTAVSYFTSSLRRVPGPFLAKFTNLWRLVVTYSGRPELRHRQLHEQYGPVVRLGPKCVSLSDPQLIKTIYNSRGDFVKTDFYSVNDVKSGNTILETIFGTRSNAYHASQNRLMHKYYTMASLKEFEPLVNTTLELLQTRLEEDFVNGNNAGKVCKMDEWTNFFAWDVIGQLTFSKPLGFLEKGGDVDGMIHTADLALDYFAVVGQIPWLDQLLDKNPVIRIGPPSFNVAGAFCANQALNRISGADKHDSEKQKDFLDHFVKLKDENPAVDVNQIVTFLLINILAGADTTAITLCAVIYYVLKNPRVHRKLQEELDSSGLELPASYDEAIKLPYLSAVVKETMRMHPGVGLTLERIVPQSGLTTPDGTVLQPGTIVGMSPWVVHMNKTIFGQDAASFVPERWLQAPYETVEEFQTRTTAMTNADLTFGAGKRACIGKNVSKMEIYKTIPLLFMKYDIRLLDPTKEWKLQNSWFVRQSDVDVQIRLRNLKDS